MRVTRRGILGLLAGAGLDLLPRRSYGGVGQQGRTEAHPLPPVEVTPGGHLLQTSDGQPFFWLGDTAWELVHHTTRDEASYYLHTRARQGFNVIQTVVLSEFNGVTEPSALGLRPFLDAAFTQPNPAYFDRILTIVQEAASLGLYVALVPVWGDKLTAPWGSGPRLFRSDNLPAAQAFARYAATRMQEQSNVIWILGGDRPARLAGLKNEYLQNLAKSAGFPPDQDWTPIWRAIAAGLAEGSSRRPLVVYHPQGGEQSSSMFLQDEPWLDVNGLQSGHGGGHDQPVWTWVARDYAQTPPRPTLDLEPNYEDHPVSPWPAWDPALGYFRDYDVRKQVYRSVFAGACGVTYGHHAVWGFINARNHPVTFADMDWTEALDRPAGRQMQHLRNLIESRTPASRAPDESLLLGGPTSPALHAEALRDRAGTWAMVYVPTADQDIVINATSLRATQLRVWWFDPRTGVGTPRGVRRAEREMTFRSPSRGPDAVLVLDDAGIDRPPPGLVQPTRRAVCDNT